jgi:hypothetical protein
VYDECPLRATVPLKRRCKLCELTGGEVPVNTDELIADG